MQATIRWARLLPYQGGLVLVIRTRPGWRVGLHGREANALFLEDALKGLGRAPITRSDWRAVRLAEMWDLRVREISLAAVASPERLRGHEREAKAPPR